MKSKELFESWLLEKNTPRTGHTKKEQKEHTPHQGAKEKAKRRHNND